MSNSPDWTKAADLPPAELIRVLDEDHDEIDDNPPATDAQLAAAVPGWRRPGQQGRGKRPAKELLTMRVESDLLAALRALGPGWRSQAGDALRRWISHHDDNIRPTPTGVNKDRA